MELVEERAASALRLHWQRPILQSLTSTHAALAESAAPPGAHGAERHAHQPVGRHDAALQIQ